MLQVQLLCRLLFDLPCYNLSKYKFCIDWNDGLGKTTKHRYCLTFQVACLETRNKFVVELNVIQKDFHLL